MAGRTPPCATEMTRRPPNASTRRSLSGPGHAAQATAAVGRRERAHHRSPRGHQHALPRPARSGCPDQQPGRHVDRGVTVQGRASTASRAGPAARYSAVTAFGRLVTTASTSAPGDDVSDRIAAAERGGGQLHGDVAPTTAISAPAAGSPSRQVPGRRLIASASSVSSSWDHRDQPARPVSRAARQASPSAPAMPSTATYGIPPPAAPARPPGHHPAAIVSRHTTATHIAGHAAQQHHPAMEGDPPGHHRCQSEQRHQG